MLSAADVEAIVPHGWLGALVARSRANIQRSRQLVAQADALVRAGRHLRRPKFAGGTDTADHAPAGAPSPRILRTLARMKEGALPTVGAKRRWVGPGRGQRCNGCADVIGARETEFEIDFSDALLLRFHAECFKTWESFDGHRR